MNNNKEKTDILSLAIFLPAAVALAFIPIFTKVTLYSTSVLETINYYGGVYDPNKNLCYLVDINTVGKASLICGFAITMLIGMLLFCLHVFKKCEKRQLIYTVAILVFLLMSLISAIGSDYKEIAFNGAFGHMEGFYVTASYCVMFLFSMYAFKKTLNFKSVVAALIICTAINFVIGCFQLSGNNLLLQDWYLSLVTDNNYKDMIQLNIIKENRQMYGALYNYNYVGSFMSMVIPIFSILAIYAEKIWQKIIMAIMAIISLFMLFASTARNGVVAIAVVTIIGIIVFGKIIIKRWKITVSIATALILGFVSINACMDNALFHRIPVLISDAIHLITPSDSKTDLLSSLPVRDIIHNNDGTVTLVTQTNQLNISFDFDNKCHTFSDMKGENITLSYDETGIATINDADFSGILLKFEKSNSSLDYFDRLRVRFEGGDANNVNHSLVFALLNDKELHAINLATGVPITPINADSIGFEGKEQIGSSRGYIWSRTLPLLKNCIIKGYGPDTYAYIFPQNDCLAKYCCYLEGFYITVDKPHNLYIQIWFSNGLIALIAFLTICIVYLVDSIKLYVLKTHYSIEQIFGLSIMLAIIGYLVTGLFNDSVVPVAPVFWILLGVGTAINAINRHANKPQDEQNATGSVPRKERNISKDLENEGAELAARIRAKLKAQEENNNSD